MEQKGDVKMSRRWPKIWGWNDEILRTDFFSLNVLHVDKDTECSYHQHQHNYNLFYLISGKLRIKSELGEVVLEPGQNFLLHPGVKHQFYGIEDCKVIEFIYVQFDPSDIQRSSIGRAVKNEKEE